MRIGTEHLEAFFKMLRADRAKLVDELVLNLSPENTALTRGRIHQIDDIIRNYPDRIKEST